MQSSIFQIGMQASTYEFHVRNEDRFIEHTNQCKLRESKIFKENRHNWNNFHTLAMNWTEKRCFESLQICGMLVSVLIVRNVGGLVYICYTGLLWLAKISKIARKTSNLGNKMRSFGSKCYWIPLRWYIFKKYGKKGNFQLNKATFMDENFLILVENEL